MGKTKTYRRRLHAKAAKRKEEDKSNSNEELMETTLPQGQLQAGTEACSSPGIFEGVQINVGDLSKQLPDDFDAKSTITSKSFRGLNIKKKDKRKLRHEIWMKKVNAIDVARKEAKARKKRQQTAVVGDMQPLEQALPTLELLMKPSFVEPKSSLREPKNPKGTKKTKQRQKEMLQDISVFRQVVNHPAYKSDPMSTIQEHLHNRARQEDAQM